jgi:molybdopterin converting factor small subunit
MIVEVQLFAAARDDAGTGRVTVTLPEPARVGELRAALIAAVPALSRYARSLRIAINNHYAADSDSIPPAAEIAAFPPVSGG